MSKSKTGRKKDPGDILSNCCSLSRLLSQNKQHMVGVYIVGMRQLKMKTLVHYPSSKQKNRCQTKLQTGSTDTVETISGYWKVSLIMRLFSPPPPALSLPLSLSLYESQRTTCKSWFPDNIRSIECEGHRQDLAPSSSVWVPWFKAKQLCLLTSIFNTEPSSQPRNYFPPTD